MDLNLLLVNLLAGSLVGYITKSLAINLLFKEYPLIGGAEIIKDRENLEKAMSWLVEERLIKPSTLLQEFQKDNFKQSFSRLIQHILHESLQQNLAQLTSLEELQGFSKTQYNLRNFLLEKRGEIIPACIDILLNQLEIKDLQTHEQWNYFIRQFLARNTWLESEGFGIFYQAWRQASTGLKLGDLISDDSLAEILKLLIPTDLNAIYPESLREELTKLLQIMYRDFFTGADWQALNHSFHSLSLAQLLAGTDFNQGLAGLIQSVLTFLNSVKGQYLLLKIVQQILILLKKMEVPLSDFLTERLEEQVVQLICAYLPEIIDTVEQWLTQNKSELEAMIQSAIAVHLQSENLIKQMIGNIFGQQLTSRYQVVENTLHELKTLLQKQGPGDIAALVSRFLHHTQVHVLADYLERYIFDEQALVKLLLELLQKYLPRIQLASIQHLLEQPLGQVPVLNQIRLERLAELGFQGVLDFCKTWILEQKQGGRLLRELIRPFWPLLKTLPISLFLPEDQTILQNYLIKCIRSSDFPDLLSYYLNFERWNIFQQRSLAEFCPDSIKQALAVTLEDVYLRAVDQILVALKQKNIRQLYLSSLELYAELSKNPAFMEHLTHTLVELMINLIHDHQMLDGAIYIAIKESFSRFSDAELKAEMDSFMGHELQPIKLLGAFLGAAVGVGMWYLSFVPGYGQFVKGNWALLSYSASYALTEVGTNWMAIKMLFRPYHAWRIPGTSWNLPFTPGIFPKNKAALADSMVNFIDKKLLSKDNMVKILEKYHPVWKTAIRRVVALDNYAVINQTLKEYTRAQYPQLTPLLLDLAFRELQARRQELAEYLYLQWVHRELNLDYRPLFSALQDWSQSRRSDWLPFAVEKLRNFCEAFQAPAFPSSSYLSAILPGLLHTLLAPAQLSALRSATIQAITNPVLAKQPLNRFLSDLSIADGVEFLFQLFAEQLEKVEVQQQLVQFIKNAFARLEIAKNSTLGSVFEGRLLQTVVQESDFIFESFSDYLLQLARSKRSEVTRLILADIETKGVMEFMLLTFGGVREDIRKVVAVLLDEKLPVYLLEKREQLQSLFETLIHERVAVIPLSELGLTEEMLNLERLLAIVRHYVANHPALLVLLKELTEAVVGNALHYLNMQDLAYLLSLQSEQAIYVRVQQQAEILQQILLRQWSVHQQHLMPQFENFFERLGSPLTERALPGLQTLPLGVWQECAEQLFSFVQQHPLFQNQIEALLHTLPNQDWQTFLDPALFRRDLEHVILKLTQAGTRRKQFQAQIQSHFESLILEFVAVLNETVDSETQEVVEEILVNSLIDSLRVNNRELLEPIDFEAIVRHEIEIMEPERIESLFDFAQPIFRLLIWYGAWGGVIGLIVGIFEWLR